MRWLAVLLANRSEERHGGAARKVRPFSFAGIAGNATCLVCTLAVFSFTLQNMPIERAISGKARVQSLDISILLIYSPSRFKFKQKGSNTGTNFSYSGHTCAAGRLYCAFLICYDDPS
ncbi:hypothetical protein PoB_001838800 [Plakobranchus ocellatus]|uniref:Uncharacterized protein n=1 Tax=Plakobranchus ocellatus TaxID=259542 RepID=A0AAV3ZBT9_9GAST|nr:hypothetical protein PoB_001838800 [Plakobranchus ocellatus]